MSKKKDPVVAVLTYFETADLALADQALSLAKEIVRKRRPQAGTRKAPTKRKPAPQPAETAPVN
jgi:hypothetical protein